MITVSLETAKKLKEAGWKKECEFVYINQYFKPFHIKTSDQVGEDFDLEDKAMQRYGFMNNIYYPTAQELLDVLPTDITVNDRCCYLEILVYGEPKLYRARYENCGDGDEKDSLAEALASCVLDAEKNGYLSF